MTLPMQSTQVHAALRHESAALLVTGQARYVDDMALPENSVHIALGLSDVAHGRLISIDTETALRMPGVRAVLTAADIPEKNDCSPVKGDDPIFAKDEIMYHGQTLFAVVADTRAQARDAVEQVKTKITPLAPILSIDAAIEQESFLEQPLTLSSGQAENAYAAAPCQLAGELYAGGQEHF